MNKKSTLHFFGSVFRLALLLLLAGGCSRTHDQAGKADRHGSDRYHGPPLELFATSLARLPEQKRDSAVMEFIKQFPSTPLVTHDTLAGLYWYGSAKNVMVSGDLQMAWTGSDTLNRIMCGMNSFFHITYALPADARLDYLLCIDTNFQTDPRNPVITPSGFGPHSQIAMPGFRSDTLMQFREGIPHGMIDSLMLASRDAGIAKRTIRIYLPPGYTGLSKLPVIYVMDGLESFEYTSYPNVADNLIFSGRIDPVIVVFVPPVDRHPEYLLGKQKPFLNAICNELVPLIDRKYRTDPSPGRRAITGISSGGHFAIISVLSRPDIFLNGAGQSPTMSKNIFAAVKDLEKRSSIIPSIKIWVDCGRFDLLRGTYGDKPFAEGCREFLEALDKARIPHQSLWVNDGHEWANWRERTGTILQYLFGKPETRRLY